MALLSDLHRQIRLHCKGVPATTMDYAVLLAVQEFCRKTWYVRETLTFTEVDGTAYYDLEATDSNMQVIGVIAVQRGDVPLYPTKQEEMPSNITGGVAEGFIFLPPATLQLVPTPDANDLSEVTVRVILAPLSTATAIPDELVRRYGQELAFGAVQHIASLPGEDWTNAQVASMAGTRFAEAIRSGKSDSVFGHKPWGNMVYPGIFNI